ncbi:MAG: T9SS type A sorting domain-containing protein [Balneola sp.]
MENGVVQIRGNFISTLDSAAYGAQNVTWDAASTPVATNDGGDYWSVDVKMAPGDTLVYKYWVGLDASTGTNDNGWESNGPFNDNYLYVLPDTSDNVTLDLDYFNNSGDGRGAPFTSEEDSVSIYFRVNVGAQAQDGSFDPETFKVGVRGNGAFFTNDWGTGDFLEKGGSKGDNLFYEGVVRAQKDSAAAIDGSIEYKFVFEAPDGAVTWESTDNRPITIPAQDSTVHWVFFNNTPPTDAVIVNTTLSFEVNVGILSGLGLFNTTIDTVAVRGTFNSWGESRMTFDSRNGVYEANNLPYTKAEGTEEKYKYYIKWDARRDSSESEFFLEGIQSANTGWEEPGVTGGADRTFTIENKDNQDKLSEFYNGVEPEALLTANNVESGAISVTFSIDMSPALQHTTPFVPASDSVYLFVDTPFFALTNGITVPGDTGENFITTSDAEKERLQFTDGDGDMVYELTLDLVLPTLNHIGFRIAYGEPTSADGSLVVNGGGFDAGRRHYQYISPQVDAQGNVTWASSFTFPELTWKASDLPWETTPDYQTVSNEEIVGNVESFRLDQNYPNPFNPSTNISFNLPTAADVSLTVYNVLGQRVATLLNNRKYTSGSHTLSFDASNLASGIYIYRIEAGSYVSQKRMTLIK